MAMVGIPRLLRRLPSDVLRLRRRRTAPGKPPTGYVDLYADATGALAGVDDDGAALSIGGGGGSSEVLAATVQLNPPDIEDLDTIAFTLVPAAGASTLLIPVQFCYFTDGSLPHDVGGGGSLQFTYAPDEPSTGLSLPDDLLGAVATKFGWMDAGSVILDRTTYENQALVVLLTGAPIDVSAGNKTLTITTIYRVLTVP